MNETLSLGDVLTGVAAALAMDGCRVVHRASFHRALVACQHEIVQLATEHGLSASLVLRLHPVERESPVLQEAIVAAVGRGVFWPDGPALHISIAPEEAAFFLARVPGGMPLHASLASLLVREMRNG